MNAALTAPELTWTHASSNELTPNLVVVLVVPTGTLTQCEAAIEKAVTSGAVTFACEVDTDERAVAEAVGTVLGTVDEAFARYPSLPLVLVGHGEAGGLTSLASEAYGEDLAGLVLTNRRQDPGPVRRAA